MGATSEFRRPIVTGSHAYGTPHADSDVDLVIFVGPDGDIPGLNLVLNAADNDVASDYDGSAGFPLTFGKLNLILCTKFEQYDCWAKGTADLIRRRPVTRDEAIAHLRALRIAAGLLPPDATRQSEAVA